MQSAEPTRVHPTPRPTAPQVLPDRRQSQTTQTADRLFDPKPVRCSMHPDAVEAVDKAASLLSELGHEVEFDLPIRATEGAKAYLTIVAPMSRRRSIGPRR